MYLAAAWHWLILPCSFRVISLALWQSYDWLSWNVFHNQKPNLFKVNTFVLLFKDIISCINTGSLNNVIHKSQTIYTWFYYTYHTLALLDSSNPFTHFHLCFFTGTTAIIWLPRYVPKKKTTRIQVKSFDIKSQHKTLAIPVNLQYK